MLNKALITALICTLSLPAYAEDKRVNPAQTKAIQKQLNDQQTVESTIKKRFQKPDDHNYLSFSYENDLIGGGTHAVSGSSETLQRGVYMFSAPYTSKIADSMRIVADLADSDKIIAHFPGGISERFFSEWNTTFVEPWVNGEQRYLWFSDEKISEHTETQLLLKPRATKKGATGSLFF